MIAMTTNKLAVAVSALAIFGFAIGARAAETPSSSPSSSVKVSIADLDLGHEGGAKVALQRIRDAARRLCSEEPFTRAIDLTHPYVDCLKATVDHAVGVLDSPMVTALNGAHRRPATVLAANRR
jgi:UrcA family protein